MYYSTTKKLGSKNKKKLFAKTNASGRRDPFGKDLFCRGPFVCRGPIFAEGSWGWPSVKTPFTSARDVALGKPTSPRQRGRLR
jgi:hypothetical protein